MQVSETIQKLLTAAGWVIGRCLPVNRNKVVFSNFYGKGYGDSPKAIAEVLRKTHPEIRLVWLTATKRAAEELPEGISAVSYHSLHRGIALGTAKVWVDNCRKSARYKKKEQKYLQTWHGFALKRVERDTEGSLPSFYPDYAKKDSSQIDLLISDSSFMTEVYRRAFWYDGEIATWGLPRNDRLIQGDTDASEKVHRAFSLPEAQKLVLYAPTFRAENSTAAYQLNFARLQHACEARFGGAFTVLVRLHPNIAALAEPLLRDYPAACNATDYPDSQELLEAADVLVTDYSSIMFDFMLTGKPCLQFATDIAAYRGERDFYLSLDSLPFPLGEDNDSLIECIQCFDETAYRRRVEDFVATCGIVTEGVAAQRCAEWILRQLQC